MCGLVGMAGKIAAQEEKIFKSMLIVDSVRGPHSTGIAGVRSNSGEILIAKKAMLPQELFETKKSEDIFRGSSKVLIGHNRWATQGKVNNVNAHPFESGNIVGAHNGTLKNQTLLLDHQMFPVDSENIIYNIDEEGIDTTLGKLNGAYALSWWDAGDSTLNFVRNDQRPLVYTFINEGKTVMWASESWMLSGALVHNKRSVGDMWYFKEDTLYTIPINVKAGDKALGKMRIRNISKLQYEAPIYQGNWAGRGGNKAAKKAAKKAAQKEESSVKKQSNPPSEGLLKTHITDGGVTLRIKDKVKFFIDEVKRDGSNGNITCEAALVKDPSTPMTLYIRDTSPYAKDVHNHNTEFEAEVATMFLPTGSLIPAVILNPSTMRITENNIPSSGNAKEVSPEKKRQKSNEDLTCEWCKEDLVAGSGELLHWFDENSGLCMECTNAYRSAQTAQRAKENGGDNP